MPTATVRLASADCAATVRAQLKLKQAAVLILRRLTICLLALAWLSGSSALARDLVDAGGRTIDVPDPVSKVFAAGPPASILLYVLAPEKMTGWPNPLRPAEAPYVAAPYRDLPALGRLTGRGGTANLEVVLRVKPDLILDFGSVRETYISLANAVQAQTGIPYALIDGRFDATPASLRLLGQFLAVEERAETLASYVENTFAEIDAAIAAVPESDRPRVYLARGPDGLETGVKGSINTEIIERAGGRNVADAPGQHGIVRASIEQVIVANPDTIITWDPIFYENVYKDPLWAGIEAVKRRRVYLSPVAPFGWIDRPPSINRVIGLKWLAGLFYPDKLGADVDAMTREFYQLFYHVDLSDAELETLIEWSKGQASSNAGAC